MFSPHPAPCLSHISPPHIFLFSTHAQPVPSTGTNKDLLQKQEDHFRKEGRYQENEENLAMFAIKERYMNAVPRLYALCSTCYS